MLFSYHTEQTGREFRVDQAVIYTTGVNYKKTSHFAALGLFHYIILRTEKHQQYSLIFHFILHFTTNKTLASLRCEHGEVHPVSPHLRARGILPLCYSRGIFTIQPTW